MKKIALVIAVACITLTGCSKQINGTATSKHGKSMMLNRAK